MWGPATCHATGWSNSVSGVGLTECATVSRRKVLFVELEISLNESAVRSTDISMFDCPEHRNTSPTRMSLVVCRVPESLCAVRTNGPPAPIAGKAALHRPDESARACVLDPASETVTPSPAAAWPHTVMGLSLCNTACS